MGSSVSQTATETVPFAPGQSCAGRSLTLSSAPVHFLKAASISSLGIESKAFCHSSLRLSPFAKAMPKALSLRLWGNNARSGFLLSASWLTALFIKIASVFFVLSACVISGILLKKVKLDTPGAFSFTSSSKGAPVSIDTVFPESSENCVNSGLRADALPAPSFSTINTALLL